FLRCTLIHYSVFKNTFCTIVFKKILLLGLFKICFRLLQGYFCLLCLGSSLKRTENMNFDTHPENIELIPRGFTVKKDEVIVECTGSVIYKATNSRQCFTLL